MVSRRKIITLLVISVFFMTALLPLMMPPTGADVQSRAVVAESEPNNTYAQADEITEGDVVNAHLDYADNDDVYKINVSRGMIFNVTLYLKDYNVAQPWEYNLDFEILSPNKIIQIAHWSEEDQVDTHSIFVQETGFHYIWVYANGSSTGDQTQPTDYQLSVNATDPIETGTGLETDFIDADNGHYTDAWYRLTIPAGQAVRAVLTCPANGDFDLILYNSWPHDVTYRAGTSYPYILNQSYQNATGNDEEVEGLAMEGSYLLKVYGWSGSGTYNLQITELSYFDDGDSTAETATVIDKSQEVLSTFHQSYDMFDWYKIHLKNGEIANVTAELMSDHGNVYFFFALTDPWGVIELWEYDTQKGGGWSSTNPVDNKAALFNHYSVGEADYFVYIRAIWKSKVGDDFKPVNAMYKITFDLPDYGPDSTVDIDPIVMDEDTSFTELDLYDHFEDPELDSLSFSYSPSPFTNVSVAIDQVTGNVNITPNEDYNTDGKPVNITFKATDGDADWGQNFATLDTTLTIKPINDGPEILIPMETYVNITEDTPGTSQPAELNKVFFDIDGDKLLYRVTGNDHIPVNINQTTTVMHIGPVSGWYGTETLTVSAEDPSGKKVSQTFDIEIKHVNHDPTGVNGMTSYSHNITEDMVDESLDVTLLFDDPDLSYAGDALRYTIEYPLGYAEPFHMDVSLTLDNHLLVEPDANFSGMEEVPIFAKDNNGSKVMVVVKVNVRPVNDGPEIRKVVPSTDEVEIEEGQTKKFEVTEPYDVDDAEMYLNFTWYVDGERQVLVPVKQKYFDFVTAYTPTTDKYSSGSYELMVTLGDGGVTVSHTWYITVLDTNRAPTGATISEPTANQKFDAGQKITLRAGSITDPDGDTLTYYWTDETEKKDLGTGLSILFSTKKLGDHKITLRVSDNRGGNATASVTIKVQEATGTGGLGGVMTYALIGIILLVVIILVVVMVMKRGGKKKEPETAKEVADSYEAKLWGDRPPSESSPPPTEEPPGTPPEEPSGPPPGVKEVSGPPPGVREVPPEPEPEPEPDESVPTWTPGGGSSDPPAEEEPAPGPPPPGPPQ